MRMLSFAPTNTLLCLHPAVSTPLVSRTPFPAFCNAARAQPKGGRLKLLARAETVPEFDDVCFNKEIGVVHGT